MPAQDLPYRKRPERADVPHAARVRPPSAAPRPPAAAVHPPRGPARETLPPPRPCRGTRPGTVLALAAADYLATAGAALLLPGPDTAPALLGALLPLLLALHAHAGLYRPGPAPAALGDLPALLGRAAVCWCAAAALLAGVRPERALPPVLLAGAVAAHTVLACYGRATVYRARRNLARRRPRAALIVGTDPAARQLAAVLLGRPEYGLEPVGLVTPASMLPAPPGPAGAAPPLPRLGSPQDIARAVIRHTVRDVVFTVSPYADPHTAALLRSFVDQGSAVWLAGAAAAREGSPPHRETDHLWGFACRRLDTGPPRHGSRVKRTLDVVVAAVLLAATAPLLLGCALVVRLAHGPGVLHRQERVGRGGRTFTLLTFRTGRRRDGDGDGAAGDGAATSRLGRLLRRTSPAGLPQLWNVLRGDLSLVGPRPERPGAVRQSDRHHPEYAARLRMPPGLTGLAQVHARRGGISAEDRVRLDNLYIDSWSLWQDLRLVLRTAGSLFRPGRR
ncbi:sugar transferase [Streptomyces lydicus]|uniref:sugar transferase n=1 Tax=Streptomyces lydicus TaxID=47763 RepID=UPI0037AAE481